MDDVDAPGGRFIHWIAWNIPVIPHIKEARPMEAEGLNDFRMHGYRGPCPSFGTHHYTFNVYALDTMPDLHRDIKEPALKEAMNGHILGFGKLVGLYKRK
jgi:Raf kinase inhibitor-like YbhB/YbcL family protein